jgi:AraC-like DNA-binding protein
MTCGVQDLRSGGFFKSLGPNGEHAVAESFDEAIAILRRYYPQNYWLMNRDPGRCRILLQSVKLNSLTLSYGSSSSAMEIRSSPVCPFYSIYFRRLGSAQITVGRHCFVSSPRQGSFLMGLRPVTALTGPNWDTFATRISPGALRLELSRMLDREIVRPIEFAPMVNYEHGAGWHVRRLLGQIFEASRNYAAGLATLTLGLRQMEESLISLVLEGLNHNYAKFVNGPNRNIAPWQLRAVEEFICQSAHEPHTLGELAAVGGVSARSLQSMFQKRRGYSPMEFLRRVRFERVREQLCHPSEKTTVTSAALQWGFLHLGRFAVDYRVRFGEKPSETLLRSSGIQSKGHISAKREL